MTGLLRHLAKFADANRRTAVRLFAAVRTAFFAGSHPHPCTEIKNARWALFISGADDRSPALDNSCPTSYCSRLRAHHSLELACTYVWLVYSYANRGLNPDPSKVIKTPAKRGCFNNWGG